MSVLFTPYDMAVFYIRVNLERSKERLILTDLFETKAAMISFEYRRNQYAFKKAVDTELQRMSLNKQEKDEFLFIMDDLGFSSIKSTLQEQQELMESFFKVIKLELLYTSTSGYRKIKLRRMLNSLGYKRRSSQLVEIIQNTLIKLSLHAYTKGKVPCDFNSVNIDDMIIIRLP